MLGGMTAVTLHAFLSLPLAVLGAVLITMLIGGLIEMIFIRSCASLASFPLRVDNSRLRHTLHPDLPRQIRPRHASSLHGIDA